MINFAYNRAHKLDDVHAHLAQSTNSKIIGGGTNLLDLIRSNVMSPREIIDINGLDQLKRISRLPDGGLSIGALVTNTTIAYDPVIESEYPILSTAILAGASPQIRNMATAAGNLLQRTRCRYFYDTATPCNKRDVHSSCSAKSGWTRMHAILGASPSCIAVHPSDMCVALSVLNATIHVVGPLGKRSIAFDDFHRLPGEQPERDTTLFDDEIILAIDLPKMGFADHYRYLKIRDRSSYAFALVSVALGLSLDNDTIVSAGLALGGVAAKPWRDKETEALLVGSSIFDLKFETIADSMLKDAVGLGDNDFKIPLAKQGIMRVLDEIRSELTS
jgi:xanthine dehydrogenase YagS FAD-binding subunit